MTQSGALVLTGGPGGGKTTLLRELQQRPEERRRWIFVPEAAPLLFQAGLNPGTKSFQRAVVGLQIALEEAGATAAAPDQRLICHRGTLDALAYWLRNGWEEGEFFASTMSRDEHLRRYIGVVHLQSAAVGAEIHYRRWPDAHRPETPGQAAEIDALCARAWAGHPRRVVVENARRDWPAKARVAREAVSSLLATQ
jgi:predicted ATPase